MKTLKNIILIAILTAQGSTSLVAMKRPHQNNNPGKEAANKAKQNPVKEPQILRTVAQPDPAHPTIPIVTVTSCEGDSFELELDLVQQSETIKNMLEDFAGTSHEGKPIPLNNISSKTMIDMIACIKHVAACQESERKITKLEIINSLALCIQSKDFINCNPKSMLASVHAAIFLDIPIICKALGLFLVQTPDCLNLIKNEIAPEFIADGYRAQIFLGNMPCFNASQIDISSYDLYSFGITDKAFYSFDITVALDILFQKLTTPKQADDKHIQDHNDSHIQDYLDTITAYPYNPEYSIKAHKELWDYVIKLDKKVIKDCFDKLAGQSTLKMALRLAYAKKHKANIDKLDCLKFVRGIRHIVNTSSPDQTQLFQQENIAYVLPFLESLLGTHVKLLNLSSYYELTYLPDSIGNLVNLTALSLCYNQLISIPNSFGNLVNLIKLELNGNKLTSLPITIGNLVNLNVLSLYNNKLSNFPDSFGNLVNLKTLQLQNNELTSLPISFGNFVNLIHLNLRWNQFPDETKLAIEAQFDRLGNNFII